MCVPTYALTDLANDAQENTNASACANYNQGEVDETDVLLVTMMMLNDFLHVKITEEMADSRIFIPLYDDDLTVEAYYMEFEGAGYAIVNNNKLNPVAVEVCASGNEGIRAIYDQNPTAKIIYDNPFSVRTPQNLGPDVVRRDEAYELMHNYHYYNVGVDEPDADMARILYSGREAFADLRSVDFNDVPSGITYGVENDSDSFINRLYDKCLQRSSDITGFTNWLNVLYNPAYGGGQVVRGFFLSQEYINRGITNGQFLTDLYDALFDREPDSGGYSSWLNLLETGYMTREQVLEGFIGSQEFIALCASFGVTP